MKTFRLDKWVFGIILMIFGFALGVKTLSYEITGVWAFIISAVVGAVLFMFLEFLEENKFTHVQKDYFSSAVVGSLCGLFGTISFYGLFFYIFATAW